MYNILLIIVTIHKCRVDKLRDRKYNKGYLPLLQKKKKKKAVSNANVLNLYLTLRSTDI